MNSLRQHAPAFSHGTTTGGCPEEEKVMGRSHAVRVQILVTEGNGSNSCNCCENVWARHRLRYWATPLSTDGDRMKSWITMTLGLVVPLQVVAQPATRSTDLLPNLRAAIEQEPSVVKARYALEAAGHAGRRIAASPYEWSVGVDGQRRRYDTGGNSNEWTARIERPIRIGGKAELDRGPGRRYRTDSSRRVGASAT